MDTLKIQGCEGRSIGHGHAVIWSLRARMMLMMLDVTHFRPGSSFRFMGWMETYGRSSNFLDNYSIPQRPFHLLKRHSNFQTTTAKGSHPKVVLPVACDIRDPLGGSKFPHM